MILGKEQMPQMMQTLVNQYTSRGNSNTNSKEQPNDALKSGKQPVPKWNTIIWLLSCWNEIEAVTC